MDVVADISATNHVSQALTRRQRDSRMCAQRPSACAKLARPLPTLLSSPDSPPVNTDLGKYTLKVDTGDPVPALLDPGDSSSVPCSAAFEKQGAGQSRGSEDLSDGRKSEAAKVATIKAQRSSHGQRDATARRGSWTRPAGPLLGPKGGLDGVDGDGCPFNNPAESAGRARRSRSRKVAVNSDGVESGAQAQAHDRSDNREVARYVARDVGKSESDNTAAIDARVGPTDPLCMEERGCSSAQEPIAHRRKDETNWCDPSAGVASLPSPAIDESGAAARSETEGAAGILSRG